MGYFVMVIAMLVAALIMVCFVFFWKAKPDDPEGDSKTMSLALRRIVLIYLMLFGALLVALLIDLNMVDFPETAVSVDITPSPASFPTPTPAATPTPSPSPAQNSSTTGNIKPASSPDQTTGASKPNPNSTCDELCQGDPTIIQVIPRSTLGSAPTIYFAVYGKNLDNSTIRFNGYERLTRHIGKTLLEAQPELSDVVGQGTITVDVITNGKTSNAIILPVTKPSARLNLGCWQPPITREIQLLLIALLAGALGCIVHGLRSIADFIGNRTAVASWFWWYITRPLLGMALALIFYAVLRGGFLAGSPADARVISPFGVLAIGALVGMFSDKAAEKLAEIFSTLFEPKSGDARKDPLSFPIVSKVDPGKITVGTGIPGTLTIKGDHLEKITKVKFDGKERNVKSSSAQQVTVDLQQEDVATVREIAITLVDSDNKTFAAPDKLSIVKAE